MNDGNETLVQVAAEPPDLILLDLLMPRVDGDEVCRRLMADGTTAFIPIIVLTGLNLTIASAPSSSGRRSV